MRDSAVAIIAVLLVVASFEFMHMRSTAREQRAAAKTNDVVEARTVGGNTLSSEKPSVTGLTNTQFYGVQINNATVVDTVPTSTAILKAVFSSSGMMSRITKTTNSLMELSKEVVDERKAHYATDGMDYYPMVCLNCNAVLDGLMLHGLAICVPPVRKCPECKVSGEIRTLDEIRYLKANSMQPLSVPYESLRYPIDPPPPHSDNRMAVMKENCRIMEQMARKGWISRGVATMYIIYDRGHVRIQDLWKELSHRDLDTTALWTLLPMPETS